MMGGARTNQKTVFDFDDWGVSDKVFHFFNKKWGPFEIDRFADSRNKKLKFFYAEL